MGKNLGEIINNIMEENSSNKVVILTEHMYIIGTIHNYQDKCKNCHECLIALKDVKIACLSDMARSKEDSSECSKDIFTHYRWFNINTNNIAGFSIVDKDYDENF